MHIEFNEHDRMQNCTAAEQLGYEHDSEEEADFDHADADINFVGNEQELSPNLKEIPSPTGTLDEEQSQRKERLNFSSDSE